MVAVCLGGVALAVLGFFFVSQSEISHALPSSAPAEVPDLIINVEAFEETVLADSVISYTLSYTNALGSSLSDVIISATLGPKQFYTGSHGYLSDPLIPTDSFTYIGDFDIGYTLEWDLGPLGANGGGWIVVTTTVPPEAEPQYGKAPWDLLGLSAVITTSTPGVSAGNPQGEGGDSVSVVVVGPALRIGKAYDPARVRPGRLLTYTLTVDSQERDDAIPANGIVITDPLPLNTELMAASGTGTLSPTAEGGLVIWHPPDSLAPGESMVVSFTVRVTNSFPSCPPSKIGNSGYTVSSEETIRTVAGKSQSTTVDDVLEKVIQAPSLPAGAKTVFPGGTVTYTISIYNPLHDAPLTGIRLTDTLPGTPNLFTYVDMVNGDSPAVISGSQVIWENLSVDAGGVTTFSFHVKVPEHIDIPTNRTHQVYQNNVAAVAPGVTLCPMHDRDPSEADVTRQIWMDKTVDPGSVLSGELVTYTITLENFGDTPINFIRLTDTLAYVLDEADFHFVDMIYGPDPQPGYQRNPVVWYPLSVPALGRVELIFRAKAIGKPLSKYGNNLSASTPETTIPARENIARVSILSPFTIDKVVDPSTTFVNESVWYTITICNVATGTYTIDRIADDLPDGMYAFEVNHFENPLVPPVDLEPHACWDYPFEADVTIDVGCDALPATLKNAKGRVGFHLDGDPVDLWWTNTADLAPLRVNPHITYYKERDHAAVLPGETVMYTITLINQSLIQVNGITVIDTLPGVDPAYFEYVGWVSGPQPVDTTPPHVKWNIASMAAGQEVVIVFRANVPQNMPLGKYKNDVGGTTTDLACVEDVAPMAQVQVVNEILELSKVASPGEVAPQGVVDYEIRVKNLDSVDVTGVVITETLPVGLPGQEFEFITVTAGSPVPSQVNGRQVVWTDLAVPGGGTLRVRFKAEAPILFGTYNNDVSGWYPRGEEITLKDPFDVKAPVVVLPGVVTYKTAYPTQTTTGGTVVYTVTVFNGLNSALEDVRITDTLPAGFTYQRKLGDTPSPDSLSPLVWELASIKKTSAQALVFEVKVGLSAISGTHYNKVEGHSPSAQIPAVEEGAPVHVTAGDTWSVYLPVVLKNGM
jgi:uncharacterized repeat protein (TIGR01451 family)